MPVSGVLSLSSSEFLIGGMERVTWEQSLAARLLIAWFKRVKKKTENNMPSQQWEIGPKSDGKAR